MAHLAECGDEALELPEELDIGDRDGLGAAVSDAGADAICHLAAQAAVGRSWEDPHETFAVNAVGTLNLCSAAVAAEPRPRLLLVSSSEVYGKVPIEDMPITEDQPLAPTTPYAASKAAAEMVGLQAWLGHGLEVVRARPFNHIGPGQGLGFVVPDLATQVVKASRGELDRIATGNLEAQRDFTDVRDVARAYRLLLVHGEPGEVYNVCRGEAVTVSDLLRRLIELSGVDVPVWSDPARARPADVPLHVGDAGRLKALSGWAPRLPLEQTLSDILARLNGCAAVQPLSERLRP
jgi:GDP-4-dehydro-6-deoxy-D-mannose reductase